MRALYLALPLGASLILASGCASRSAQQENTAASPQAIDEEHPGYYEPELYRRYHDPRYEEDPAFEKYYEWKREGAES